MPLITENGFAEISPINFMDLESWDQQSPAALDVPNDLSPDVLAQKFEKIEVIRIPFPSFADGRGFSLAKTLRNLGYQGRLRAKGHIISDQFSYALDSGFDEVEIDEEQAERQPENHWKYTETVTEVEHFTDRLFRFRTTRPASFRFRSGEFVMIGLPNAEKPVYRAYSIASPAWDDTLEFYSIKVPDGPLTRHLQKIVPGDKILLKKKATGTLVHDALLPGKRLWMLSTGTGIAPFASLIRDPDTYEKFDQVILVHTCRQAAELKYGYDLIETAKNDPLVGEQAAQQLIHYATTTREETANMGRITTLIDNGKLFADLGIDDFGPAQDRVMICGSMDMLKELKAICEARGFDEGTNREPSQFAVERAFVG